MQTVKSFSLKALCVMGLIVLMVVSYLAGIDIEAIRSRKLINAIEGRCAAMKIENAALSLQNAKMESYIREMNKSGSSDSVVKAATANILPAIKKRDTGWLALLGL